VKNEPVMTLISLSSMMEFPVTELAFWGSEYRKKRVVCQVEKSRNISCFGFIVSIELACEAVWATAC
jgi:hypothetical protein